MSHLCLAVASFLGNRPKDNSFLIQELFSYYEINVKTEWIISLCFFNSMMCVCDHCVSFTLLYCKASEWVVLDI